MFLRVSPLGSDDVCTPDVCLQRFRADRNDFVSSLLFAIVQEIPTGEESDLSAVTADLCSTVSRQSLILSEHGSLRKKRRKTILDFLDSFVSFDGCEGGANTQSETTAALW